MAAPLMQDHAPLDVMAQPLAFLLHFVLAYVQLDMYVPWELFRLSLFPLGFIIMVALFYPFPAPLAVSGLLLGSHPLYVLAHVQLAIDVPQGPFRQLKTFVPLATGLLLALVCVQSATMAFMVIRLGLPRLPALGLVLLLHRGMSATIFIILFRAH